MSDHADDVDVDGSNLFVNPIERALVHEFHADTNVRFGNEGAKTRYDVF